MKRIRGKKRPLSSAGLHALHDEYTWTIEPAHGLAAETLQLERLPSAELGMRSADCPVEIELMGKTALPRIPIGQGSVLNGA